VEVDLGWSTLRRHSAITSELWQPFKMPERHDYLLSICAKKRQTPLHALLGKGSRNSYIIKIGIFILAKSNTLTAASYLKVHFIQKQQLSETFENLIFNNQKKSKDN
jgi:hypothetical protein